MVGAVRRHDHEVGPEIASGLEDLLDRIAVVAEQITRPPREFREGDGWGFSGVADVEQGDPTRGKAEAVDQAARGIEGPVVTRFRCDGDEDLPEGDAAVGS